MLVPAALLCTLLPEIASAQAVSALEINPAARHQTVRGFGASGAWWPNYVAEFPDAERDHILRLLFTDAGAGLTVYRSNLPAGDGPEVTEVFRRTVLVETAPGEYDFSRDWKSQRILQEVRALGVRQFVLFSVSPPPRLLINGLVSGGTNGNSNLKPGAEGEFARYLLDLTEHYMRTYDLPEVMLSPINEPQWHWGRDRRHQEGCHFTPEEMAATVRALILANRERRLPIEIEAPESGEWKNQNYAFAKALFDDPEISAGLHTFAVHSYWSSNEDRSTFVAWFRERYPDKTLAMTEFCQMEHGHDLGMESGLRLAQVMHEDLVVANVETWQWWLCVHVGGYKDALIYAHPETRKVETTKRLWVMGNYSRFIAPGSVRIEASVPDELKASAYLSPDGTRTTIVVINAGQAQPLALKLPAGTRLTGAWTTSAEHDLAPISTFPLVLPHQSVTTLTLAN